VIGYFFRATGKFSAYTASTVPWHKYMSDGQLKYNLLPTGCYVYKKGAHRPENQDRWVDPAFRLSDAAGADSGPATVLRTPNDTVFDLDDPWDKCAPSDNIHCAYSDEKFSSLGCQTVKGGMHDGLWARFQATIKTLPKNARVDYVLLTGAEASIAAAFARDGKTPTDAAVHSRLGRLRVGSEGEEVVRLQAALGMQTSTYFGAATKKRLTELQKQRGLSVDGVFSPAIEGQFGGQIFGQQAAPAATSVTTPATATSLAAPATAAATGAATAASAPVSSPMVPPITPVAPPVAQMPAPAPPAAAPATAPPQQASTPPQQVSALPQASPPPRTPAASPAPAMASRPSNTTSATSLLVRDTLRRIAPRPSSAAKAKIWDNYVDALTSEAGAKVFADYGLDKSPQRLVFILANMCAETGGLSLIWESMNYSADRLVEIFGDAANIDYPEARRLAGNPEAIGERVYGLGNDRKARQLGNTEPGDGFRFRGGGFLQTTGRDNYRKIGKRIGEDLENHPELIENPLISLKAACAEWQGTNLNQYADDGSFRACCNGINYGDPKRDRKPIGFNDRLDYLQRGLNAFHLPPVKRKPGALESTDDPEMKECGDLGPPVAAVQRQLKALGYPVGPPNGQFNTQTRDALLSFQANNGLATTGESDRETRLALNSADAIVYKDAPRGDLEMLPPAAGKPAASAPKGPVQVAPARESSGVGFGTLLAALLGLAVTFGLLAIIVGWLPVSSVVLGYANDAATPVMLMGWILALLAALQARRRAA
jgi:putative chitinase